MQPALTIYPVAGIPIICAGDDLAQKIDAALSAASLSLLDGDVLAVAQKIVSLAEGRSVRLDEVDVSVAILQTELVGCIHAEHRSELAAAPRGAGEADPIRHAHDPHLAREKDVEGELVESRLLVCGAPVLGSIRTRRCARDG